MCSGKVTPVQDCATLGDYACSSGQCVRSCAWRAVCADANTTATENPCTGQRIPMQTCTSLGAYVCINGSCQEPPVNPHVAGELSFGNMPYAFNVVRFPHKDLDVSDPAPDTCRSTLVSSGPAFYVPMEGAAQVSVEGPTGANQVQAEMFTDDGYPYYMTANPPEWNPASGAGRTFIWHVIGKGPVPSFSLSITAPDPVTSFSPLPRGQSLIDFSRAAPPMFVWPPTQVPGATMEIVVSGLDAGWTAQRVLVCNPSDDGAFTFPASELLQFAPGTLSLKVTRFVMLHPAVPGLSGGVTATCFSGYLPLDGQLAAVPLIYTVN
jgi:hypothetical protein